MTTSKRTVSYQRTRTRSQPCVADEKQKIATSDVTKIAMPWSQLSTPISSSCGLKMKTNGRIAVRMS